MKYSKTTGGFYSDAINYDYVPEDAVDITEDQHAELLMGSSLGKAIAPDADGNPILIDPAPPSMDDLSGTARAQRDNMLQKTDWRVTIATESGNALSDDWKTYRQALRDVPAQKGFPVKIKWPVAPAN